VLLDVLDQLGERASFVVGAFQFHLFVCQSTEATVEASASNLFLGQLILNLFTKYERLFE
jgi:hypothetical protein